ncbi:MAG TPA: protein kinase [Blastocatellia bacterium]|nr:protein kinase [Blastocatellia bacterium]
MLARDTLLQNRYRVVRLLAEGGMGAVYEAVDERLGNVVALKKTFFSDDQMRSAFEREARLLARLRHAALPVVSDHFTEGDGQFLVMQFIPGDDLEEMLTRRGEPFPPEEALRWADQLLDALDYLHTQQPPIIHRDIKPQNLKLAGRGQVVLLDFGLAKGDASQSTRLTSAKSIFGYTPHYAPIEQIQGSGTDHRSDLYSLAATLYHLMTGVVPPGALQRLSAVAGNDPDPMQPANALNPKINPSVSHVLKWATEIKSDRRPASAQVMRKALSDAGRSNTVVGRGGQKTVDLPPTQLAAPVTRRIDPPPSDPQRNMPPGPPPAQPFRPTVPNAPPPHPNPSWPPHSGAPPAHPSWPPPPPQQGWRPPSNPQASHPSWPPPSYPPQPAPAYQTHARKKSGSSAWIIALVAVIVIGGLIAVVVLIANSDRDKQTNTNISTPNVNRNFPANTNKSAATNLNMNAGADRPPLDRVLDRYVEALGGRDALQSLTSRVTTGTFEMPDLGLTGTAEIYAKAPNRLMYSLTLPGVGTTRTGFNGATGWAEDPQNGLRSLTGKELEDMKRDAMFYKDMELESAYQKLELKGPQTIDGRSLNVVEATASTGATTKMFFDKESGLLVREEAKREGPEGMTETKTTYENYTKIDGVYLPFTMRQSSSLVNFVVKIKEVRHNVAIDDAKFNMPRTR